MIYCRQLSRTMMRLRRLMFAVQGLACLTLPAVVARAQESSTLVIGGENDRILQLGAAPQVIITPRHVLLVESKAPFIRVLRNDGTLQQSFGRRGGGPGEIGGDFKVRFDSSSGQVVVFDYSNSRLSFYGLKDSLVFLRSTPIQVAPFDGCMVEGTAWQTVPGKTFLQKLDIAGARLRPGRSVGTVSWFDRATKDPAINRFVSQIVLACNPTRRLALLSAKGIGEAHLVALDDNRQYHVRILDFKPMTIERSGQGGMMMRIPDDGVYDMTDGVLVTPLGLELVVGRHTPWVKGREEAVTYRRVLVSDAGAQRVVAQSAWRPLAVSSDGAYCYADDPAPTLARLASGRCP